MTPEIQSQQLPRIIARPPGIGGPGAHKPQPLEIQRFDERRDRPYRIPAADIFIKRARKQRVLSQLTTSNVAHSAPSRSSAKLSQTATILLLLLLSMFAIRL